MEALREGDALGAPAPSYSRDLIEYMTADAWSISIVQSYMTYFINIMLRIAFLELAFLSVDCNYVSVSWMNKVSAWAARQVN